MILDTRERFVKFHLFRLGHHGEYCFNQYNWQLVPDPYKFVAGNLDESQLTAIEQDFLRAYEEIQGPPLIFAAFRNAFVKAANKPLEERFDIVYRFVCDAITASEQLDRDDDDSQKSKGKSFWQAQRQGQRKGERQRQRKGTSEREKGTSRSVTSFE